MGLWAETVGYRQFRHPYLPRLFSAVAETIPLSGREQLLDLGCGAGEVAFGFAPYVAGLTGIDLEEPMLQEAQRRADALGRKIRLIHAQVEDAPEELGPFDLITIGRAHWFMHTPATLARLDRWLLPEGRILVCQPLVNPVGAEWQNLYQAIRIKWARGNLREKLGLTHEKFFQDTSFAIEKKVTVRGRRKLALDHLIKRTLGTPGTTLGILGPQDSARMIEEIRAAMAPYFRDGPLIEDHITLGFLYRRRGDGNAAEPAR